MRRHHPWDDLLTAQIPEGVLVTPKEARNHFASEWWWELAECVHHRGTRWAEHGSQQSSLPPSPFSWRLLNPLIPHTAVILEKYNGGLHKVVCLFVYYSINRPPILWAYASHGLITPKQPSCISSIYSGHPKYTKKNSGGKGDAAIPCGQ